jgi:hypothetical protein
VSSVILRSLDGWGGKLRLARRHHEAVFQRIPGRTGVGLGRRAVVALEVADQRARDAEDDIGLEVLVIVDERPA